MKLLFSTIFTILFSLNLHSQETESFAVLSSAQKEIDMAFIEAFRKESSSPFKHIGRELNALSTYQSPTIKYYVSYWLSYMKYKESIFLYRTGKREESIKKISEAIAILEKLSNKDSEIYALLALEQSFNFQFIPQQEFIIYMRKLSENLEQSLALNKQNLRSYYVNASYDFYTPEAYGGGKKAEKYLLKAINLEDKTKISSFAPTWGKELSYGLLIEFYIKCKNKKSAEKYYNEAIKYFPKSIYLNKYLKLIQSL